jgi:hypothetical protein
VDEGEVSAAQITRKNTLTTSAMAPWEYASKIVVYEDKSLYLFSHKSKFRRIVVAIIEQKIFDQIILALIVLNSMALACYDYSDTTDCTVRNQVLNNMGHLFSLCFFCECVLKLIGMGAFQHYNSYLQDKWNWLDFLVVMISIVELLPIPVMKLRALRTFRVLRPLRSFKAMPAMRKLI